MPKHNFPRKVRPMLAKLVDEPFDREGWRFEVKWDGYRAIADVKGGEVALYSRNGNSLLKYEPVVEALKKIRYDAVFDGEIVALLKGKPSFHALQFWEEKPVPLQYVIFDLLYFKGKDLRKEPLKKRQEILKKNFPKSKTLFYGEHIEGKGKAFFRAIEKKDLEGMVAKDESSVYQEGKRTGAWLKIKHRNMQEAVIAGFTAPRGSRKLIGALILAAKGKNGKLQYIGHSGGGFTHGELRDLHAMLSKIKVGKSPFEGKIPVNAPVTWVKPKYVAEIAFSEWTPDGRMRHPIYMGLRSDKKSNEVKVESPEPSSDLKLSNLDKIFWPEEGYTKGDVIEYYRKISPVILPYLLNRAESMNRHPNGWKGKNFFQKDIKGRVPDFVETKEIWSETNKAKIRFLICNNEETLLYMANLGCIELNPWNSRVEKLDYPDYMILDLDPGKRPFKDLIKVAQAAHRLLDDACEEPFVKTSGKKGLHILVPLGAKYDYDVVRQFAELLMRIINRKLPELTSIERNPRKRGGKIYLDYLQNRRGQTIAAPYSIRPFPGATVSTPLKWSEVNEKLDPSRFTIKTIWKRLDAIGDLWKGILSKKTDLHKSIKCLQGKEL